jgi:hypothetical protein
MKVFNWLAGRGRPEMIEVHHFKVLDAATGKWVIPSYKCSEKRIAELKGDIILSTMQIVARSSLDKDGCYHPKPLGKEPG